jgi:hypothetical protein
MQQVKGEIEKETKDEMNIRGNERKERRDKFQR